MTVSTFEIKNNIDRLIKGDLYFSQEKGKYPLILMLHGFKSWRKWGFLPFFSESLANKNAIVINIDHSLNGIIDEETPFFDSEVFAQQTISQYIIDAQITIEKFIDGSIDKEMVNSWDGRIFLVGHSLGAAVSLLVYNQLKCIDSIVILGGISKIDRNSIRQKELWKERGFVDVRIAINNQMLKLNYTYIEDKMKYDDDILNKIMSKCIIPVLIIHGGLDMTVKKREAIELYENATDKSITELLIVEKTGHTFGSNYRFTDTNVALQEAIEKTIDFLKLND